MRFLRAALATTFVVVLGVSAAFASGSLAVHVVDSNGDPLPAATVTISHNAGNIKPYAELTDRKGWARFPVLRPGPGYVIDVSFPGFGTRREDGISIKFDQETRLPIQLAEEIQERVKVVATTNVVQLEETASTTRFTDEFIQDLPVPGRFYQNVLTLAPGVQDADGDGNPNVHGSRSRDFKGIVSGVSNVDPLTGQQMAQINPNSIQEMQVITGGAGAEFGRAQGGFANIIQKQGTNDFEGVFEFYYRTSKLDGDGAGDFSNLPDVEFDWFQPSGQLSGPIVRDKLWFRLSHELIDQQVPVPTGGSGLETIDVVQGIHSDQITWQVSPRNKMAVQWQYDPLEIEGGGVSSFIPKESTLTQERGTETYQLTWTAPYSPKVLVESTAAWQDSTFDLFPFSRGVPNSCAVASNPDDQFIAEAQCDDLRTGTRSGSHWLTQTTRSQRLTIASKATVYGGQFLGANHQFKFGITIENERYFRDRREAPRGVFFEEGLDPDAPPNVDPVNVFLGTLSVPERVQTTNTGTNWSVFAEDQIRPVSNLVINLGVRLDREEINGFGKSQFDPRDESADFLSQYQSGSLGPLIAPSVFSRYEGFELFITELSSQTGLSRNELIAHMSPILTASQGWRKTRRPDNVNIINTNFAPRVSISWDPWNDGKTKFAVSAGRYYGVTILDIPLRETNAATTRLGFDVGAQNGEIIGLNSSVDGVISVRGVDRSLDTPYQDEWRVLFERELWTETALRVEYIRRKYRQQFQDFDLNLLDGDLGRCVFASQADPDPIVTVEAGDAGFDPALTPGDGIPDDCVGDFDRRPLGVDDDNPESRNSRLERPDGILDLYIQNPAWDNVYQIANINFHDYEGVVLELTRRQYRSWEMTGSYTWSVVRGNGEDFIQQIGNDTTTIDDEFGYQSYDQRHVVKLAATTITPWGFRLGGTAQWQSGLPWSVLALRLANDNLPPFYKDFGAGGPADTRWQYPSHQRNDQRNVPFWTLDLKATKELNLGRNLNLQFSAEVFNLLNDGTYRVYNSFNESGRQINGQNEAEPLFGRRWQLGMKMAF